MTVRASFQKSYLWRYLAMAGIGLFMAIWFAFDGLIGYPREQKRSAAYEELAKEISDPKELRSKWREIAKSSGWSVDTPREKSAEFESKINGQYIFGGLCLLIAIPAVVKYFRSKHMWVESTDGGLSTSWGQSMQFADVVQLNKKRWASKGIAKAFYTQNGQDKCFVFDDFKFDRQPLGEILKQLEAVLKPDQIVGGPPESQSATNESNEEEDSPS